MGGERLVARPEARIGESTAAVQSPRTVICLTGPTATGKTNAALALARRFPVAIVSVDSAMVYRELDIGTGKPSPAELREVPHHLVDIRDPLERYSAGDFVRDATDAIDSIHGSGRIPLLVGGTMLYFRSLLAGLSPLPRADATLRAAIDARAATEGWSGLHAELARLDPVAAARIEPGDRQRIQRALEVYMKTGEPISVLQGRATPRADWAVLTVGLLPSDRERHRESVARRFHDMLARGLVAEVEALAELPGMNVDRPAMRAVGYRQVWQYLDGQFSYDESVTAAITATRQLAKRQMTWLRRWRCDLVLDSAATDVGSRLADWFAARLPSGALSGRNR